MGRFRCSMNMAFVMFRSVVFRSAYSNEGVDPLLSFSKTKRGAVAVGGPSLLLGVLVALFAVWCVAGCAPSKTKAPESATKNQPYDFQQEGDVPPLDESAVETEADVEEIPVEEDEIVAEDVPVPVDSTKAKAGGGPDSVMGRDGSVSLPVLRVQIMATTSEQSARDVQKRVENMLNLPAYVSLEDGMYKVRVGDCTTRLEAEKVRNRCREQGYTDAWIVHDVIKSAPPSGGGD